MATIQDAIKRLTYIFSSQGADQVVADNNKVTSAIVSATTTQTSANLSLDKSFANIERRFDSTIRAQQDYQKVVDKVNAAVAQNPGLQERANNVLALASEHFDRAKGSASAFNAILDAGRGAALGYAAGIGPIGAVLGSFGPWGVAAAAGIGLVVNALDYMNQKANEIGTESSGLKQFADTTGLTVTQVRGLTEAGAELGIASDTVSSSIQKFTFSLDEARKGGGALYDQVRSIDGQLAIELASTRSGAEALDILTKAYNSTTDATTKAAIARAAFGKGGASFGNVLGVVGDAGGVDAYSASVQKALGVTDEWTDKVAALRNENRSLESDLKLIEASIYSQSALDRQNQFLKTQIEIAKTLRDAVAKNEGVPQVEGGAFFSQLLTPSAPSSTTQGPDFGSRYSDATSQIKAANDATAQLTGSTDLLTAAQNKADQAMGVLSAIESSSIAPANALSGARKSSGDALQLLAGVEAQRIQYLNGAATGEEILKQKTDALTAGFLQGTKSADDYNRALHGDTASVFAGLEDQLAVLNAIAGAETGGSRLASKRRKVAAGEARKIAKFGVIPAFVAAAAKGNEHCPVR